MRNLSIKNSISTEIIVAIIFVLLLISTGLSAKGLPKTDTAKKDTASLAKKEVKKVLSAEEIEFYNSIEEFYQTTYVKNKKEIVSNEIEKIVVYNQLGETVLDKKSADTVLPKGATKLFTEGKTAYYLIF
ncbi:MAG: hypothetical protein ACI85I_000522 [Arenicella sp.]|jgi:uncharacterized protein YpmB